MCRLIMVMLVFIFSNAQEYFNITRQPSTLSHTDVPDVFRIPTWRCGESKGGEECPPMGGRKIGDCQCICNTTRSIDNRRVAYKSTFGFYGGKWKCVNNSLLWNQTGCLRLTEKLHDPIKTLSRTVMKTTSSNSSDSLTRLIVNSSTCTMERLIAENSSYLDCEGKWKSFNGTSRFNCTNYGVEFNLESDRLEPRLEGLIIRLGVKCFNSSSVSCLLLKLDGHQICLSPSPSSSAVATPTSSFSALNSTSCGKKCKTPTQPSLLHTMMIGILVAMAILLVFVTASILMNKALRKNTKTRRKRKMRQPFVPQMSAPTENNAQYQSVDDVVQIDQECREENGYLCPVDIIPISNKSYDFDKVDSKETDGNAEQLYIEESGPSMESSKSYRLRSLSQIHSNVGKLNSTPQIPSSGSHSECKGYKPSIAEPDPNNSGRSLTRNENVSKEDPIYHILEDTGACGTYDSASGTRRDDTVEINQRKSENFYNNVGQIHTENVSKIEDYQELSFDGQRLPHVYQSLCIEKKSQEKETL